jgi:hypothetical protein
MTLAEKMFTRSSSECGIRTECRTASDRRYFGDIFAEDWEVFVIKHDPERGKFDWFTLCCDAVNANCDNMTNAACAA